MFNSTQPKAINPKRTIKRNNKVDENEDESDPDKIDPFGENPNWSDCWVKAHKINYLGRVSGYMIRLIVYMMLTSYHKKIL